MTKPPKPQELGKVNYTPPAKGWMDVKPDFRPGTYCNAAGSKWMEWIDVMFEFASLTVHAPGTYEVVFSLDGSAVAELPLEVRSLKQAAEPSGR